MKAEKKRKPEDLRIMPDEFDEMMRYALGVSPERKESGEKAKPPQKLTKRKEKTTD